MRPLELLAPAKNLQTGIAAIDHGADAVYIGAGDFGARQAAANSMEDIRQLCAYARPFGVKVYVTVNTIVYAQELETVEKLLVELGRIPVDGILIQDMGLVDMTKRQGLPLHASTQCDTRTAEKVQWLRSLGFRRAVLARELSAEEVRRIHEAVPDMELEVFVHGALCVSYSGVCYASQQAFGRSANRGACAQFCRLRFDLVDDDGKMVEKQRYFLSLKDLCLIDHLEELADAGACSFKIEGRLKDAAYVKNVVSAYSIALDGIVSRRPREFCRPSWGKVERTFSPDLRKTFNRDFTTYFLHGRQTGMGAIDTPKVRGTYVGTVKELFRDGLTVAGTASYANGDGLCFFNGDRELEGFRVNRAEGNRLFVLRMPAHLRKGMPVYRNHDEAFDRQLEGQTAIRKVPVRLKFSIVDGEVVLEADNGHQRVRACRQLDLQKAKTPQRENWIRQLTKLGNTPYRCENLEIGESCDEWFVPNHTLTALRREVTEALAGQVVSAPLRSETNPVTVQTVSTLVWQPEYAKFPYLYNISNPLAQAFYRQQGLAVEEKAFECSSEKKHPPLVMQCRYCIRYALGYCVKRGGRRPLWKEPLHLVLPGGKRYQLEFDCKSCQMNIYAEK